MVKRANGVSAKCELTVLRGQVELVKVERVYRITGNIRCLCTIAAIITMCTIMVSAWMLAHVKLAMSDTG